MLGLRLYLRLRSRRLWMRFSLPSNGSSRRGHAAGVRRGPPATVLQTSYDDLYAEVVQNPRYLRDIEDLARGRSRGEGTTGPFARDNGERLKAMFALEPHFEPKNDDELRALVYLTEATG
jgi:hypothetical protein